MLARGRRSPAGQPEPLATLITLASEVTTWSSLEPVRGRRSERYGSHVASELRAVLGAGLMLTLAGACSDQAWTTSIIEAEYRESTQTLAVSVSACNAHLSPEVVETSSEVRITVMAEGGDPGADCADGFEVRLERPLGGRQVFDDGDGGNVIAVTLDQ